MDLAPPLTKGLCLLRLSLSLNAHPPLPQVQVLSLSGTSPLCSACHSLWGQGDFHFHSVFSSALTLPAHSLQGYIMLLRAFFPTVGPHHAPQNHPCTGGSAVCTLACPLLCRWAISKACVFNITGFNLPCQSHIWHGFLIPFLYL